MKKGFLTLVFLALCGLTFAQLQTSPQWTRVLSDQPETFRTQLISSSENSIKVNVQVPGFYTTNVTTPRGEAKVITMPKAVSTAKAGEPEMPMTGIPAIIGDQARMSIRVIDAQYMDFEGIEVAPSKGDFPRTINPEDVPYTYGECYSQDAFFPANNVGLYEPYIVRDFRGQNMVVYPYAYNPVSKTLRVYYNMTVEMYKVDDHGTNVMETRRSNTIKMDPDFKSMYQRHFINYEAAMNRYTALDEEGDLLIICYDNFINYMTDFVNWKKTRGINTTIVGTSTAGSSYSAIQTYIKNQYNANNNITHVLLVGDVAQIPGYSYSGGGSSYGGKGDNAYGQIVGSDIYNDVFIGRFSASSASQVTTQCNRTITYERDLTTSATWLQVGEGISRKEGGSGHNSEDDYQHINNIRTDLLNYGYTTVYQRYANLTGYDGSSATISSDINSGVGIINYANHGQETAWGANSSGYIYYANSHVNALTNENKLPFIWSVACLCGKYDYSSGDCFAETWMHATNNSNPTGAVGTLMSYISQPWIPPMWAQDECVDILVESYSSNIKHTWGGTSINGLMGIFDHYSTSEQSAVGTYQAWVLYGDPSLMLRTKTPTEMTVTHNGTIAPSATSYSVTVTNGSGAVATITDANHNILGKATVSGTTANISISGTLTVGSELTLCVFGYNKVTYLGTITVQGGTQYTITANASPTAGGNVTGGGTYYSGTSCTLTATPNTGYTFTNWKKGNNVVSTEASYTFTVTASATYTATFTAIPQYTVSVSASPTAGGTVSGGGTFYENTQCTLTATPNTGYTFTNWKKGSTIVSTSATYTFNVTETATYTATFTAIPQYTITATANPTSGGTVTGGGTFYENTQCTLTATANTHYEFVNWTRNGTQVSTNPTYTFTVTSAGAYTANFTALQQHTVTCAAVQNGTISATPALAYRDETVTLSATPSAGYYFGGWTVTDASNNTIPVTDNQFTMPDSDVTVSASFVQGYNVTLASVMNGSIGATPTSCVPGTTVTLTATPDAGYVLDSWMVFKTGDVNTAVSVSGNSFAMPSHDVTVVGIFSAPQGVDVTIGSGTSNNINLPTNTNQNYSVSQQIFTASEVGEAGTITKVAFRVSNSKSTTRTLEIYLSHTTKSSFSSTSNWVSQSSTYKVFSGSVTFEASGWTTITLDTPFDYNGASNLLLTVDDNTNSALSNSNRLYFYHYTTTSYTSLYKAGGTNYSPANTSGLGSGTRSKYSNQVIFTKAAGGTTESLSVAPVALGDFSYAQGEGPSAAKAVTLVACAAEGITVTAPEHFEVSDAADGTYGATLSIPVSSRGGRATLTYDFEDGWQNWTTFQGSTTSPHSWMHNTEYPTTNNDFSSGYGYGSSDGFMLSESYISGSTSGSGTAVTPDNYLVSPQVTLGGSITFQAGVQNVSYCAEKFSVMVSTTGNTSASDFTTVQTWTYSPNASSGSEWQEFTVDLSAYSGTGYIAIRHFDCYDQWILKVDDVTIVEGEETPVNPTNPTNGELVTANVYVRLKAGLTQGSYANEPLTVSTGDLSGSVSLSGEVTQGSVISQPVSFVAGWNWWSPAVESPTLLADLETALGANGVSIVSSDNAFVYNYGAVWVGDIEALVPGKMYMVQTNAACTLAVEGEVPDPASHEVTLVEGYNWIGYVGTESMLLAPALSDLEPSNGDVIMDTEHFSTYYTGIGWVGDLTSLEPGTGYMYKSNYTGTKTFYFPSTTQNN